VIDCQLLEPKQARPSINTITVVRGICLESDTMARKQTVSAHPLDPIGPREIERAAALLRKHLQTDVIRFKVVDLLEAAKKEVLTWINGSSAAPDRKARIYYHVDGSHTLSKACVNITNSIVEKIEQYPDAQGPVDYVEFEQVHEACNTHPKVLEEIAKLKLPPNAKVLNDPWAYGTDDAEERRRLFQCYMYIVLTEDPEANHYSLPAPFAPVFDAHTLELVRIDRLPLGEDSSTSSTAPWDPVEPVEYSAATLGENYFRTDLKPLQVLQPEGSSFNVSGRNVKWQKWSFQLGWNQREGPVLHNVTYDGRSLFYRVAMSEMTVPYGDPRAPFRRKQAFDLGDAGFGLTSNTLALGCDCLGVIEYFDGHRVSSDGHAIPMKNVVCMHEVDQGIGWKHTNFRNSKASVVRNRQLVIQCTATVSNYEYIMAFVLDQAANLHIEVRATGIVSTMPVAKDTHTPWGTVVAPGVVAVNHQHLFNVRIDPALDGQSNTIIYDDAVPVVDDSELDPTGCAFRVDTTKITKPGGYETDLSKSRTFKIINPSVVNPVSGKPVGYKLHAIPSQYMMMGKHTFNYKRGIFASKPIWVTKYRDEELWAAGEFTNQSREDTGLAIWADRDEDVENEDVVLWHSFGITHVTRPEGEFGWRAHLLGFANTISQISLSCQLRS
jgi:primary-amine oxidase